MIQKLPDGILSNLGESGHRISGGEKEKLYDAFARKDTAKVIEIHRDINTIIEAEEKAGK